MDLPKSLPRFKDRPDDANDPWQAAYRVCLQYENEARSRRPDDPCHNSMEYPRILGQLLQNAPNFTAMDTVSREIIASDNDLGKLQDLGDLYKQSCLRVFLSSPRQAHTPRSHPTRRSFDGQRNSLMGKLKESIHITPSQRTRALEHYGRRCLVTGCYGLNAPEDDHDAESTILQVAHIVPQSINRGISDDAKREQAAEIWTVMERFGAISLDELNGSNIHRCENLMVLSESIHSLFDRLEVWFEPTGDLEARSYLVKTAVPIETIYPPLPPTFTIPEDMPAPSAAYLSLHAACARAAHLSGIVPHNHLAP